MVGVIMNYEYKCKKCNGISEVTIHTYDIIDRVGRVDQEELMKRIKEYRECQCGGELQKIITYKLEPLWFDAGIGRGKISSRFK